MQKERSCSRLFFDADLKRIFETPERGQKVSAYRFLRKNKKELMARLAFWTREKKYVVDQLYSKLEDRSKALNLSCDESDPKLLIDLISWLSSIITSFRLSGKWSRRLS